MRSLSSLRVSSDQGLSTTILYLVNIVDRFAFADLRSVYPSTEILPRFAFFSSLVIRSFSAYLTDGSDSAPALTWTHVFASSNFRDDIARAQDQPRIWRVSLPTGALLVLDWLGSGARRFSRATGALSMDSQSSWCQALACDIGATLGTSIFSLIYLGVATQTTATPSTHDERIAHKAGKSKLGTTGSARSSYFWYVCLYRSRPFAPYSLSARFNPLFHPPPFPSGAGVW
jgi:hypothetical protein